MCLDVRSHARISPSLEEVGGAKALRGQYVGSPFPPECNASSVFPAAKDRQKRLVRDYRDDMETGVQNSREKGREERERKRRSWWL